MLFIFVPISGVGVGDHIISGYFVLYLFQLEFEKLLYPFKYLLGLPLLDLRIHISQKNGIKALC